MSRLWTKGGLRLHIAEDHLGLLTLSGGFRPRLVDSAILPFAAGDWSAAMVKLEEWLAGNPRQRRAQVTLGSHWLRFLVLPWDPQLMQGGFRDGLVSALLMHQYQESAKEWSWRVSSLTYGKNQLAVCFRRTDRGVLQSTLQRHGTALHLLRPILAAVWNFHRQELRRQSGQLILLEGYRLLQLRHVKGGVEQVGLRPYAPDEIPAALITPDVRWVNLSQRALQLPGLAQLQQPAFPDVRLLPALRYGVTT